MSKDIENIVRGDKVLYKEEEKIIKDFYLVFNRGIRNNDIMRFIFTDGTTNEDTGFEHIKEIENDE